MKTYRLQFVARKHALSLCRSLLLLSLAFSVPQVFGQRPRVSDSARPKISNSVMLQIVRAEDERHWGPALQALLADKDTEIRQRAALAAGRIGDEHAVPALVSSLQQDSDESVRAMAAFALGEIESVAGADALIAALSPDKREPAEIRAPAVEALGKIVAALPKSEAARARPLREAIVAVLEYEAGRRSLPDREVVLLGLTAALRARPENAGKLIARFLSYADPRVRADAANTLARLRLKDGNDELRKLLTSDPDEIVRANAARVLGATEDKAAFAALLDRALHDDDLRVRVSAIRALGALKDERAAQPLFEQACRLMESLRGNSSALMQMGRGVPPTQQNEWLEIFSTLGNILVGKHDVSQLKPPLGLPGLPPPQVVAWNKRHVAREFEIATAKISPEEYVNDGDAIPFQGTSQTLPQGFFGDWRRASSVSQGLGVIATLDGTANNSDLPKLRAQAQKILHATLDDKRLSVLALPEVITAYAAFKPGDLSALLRGYLQHSDVIVRSTAAELIGNLPPDEANTRTLVEGLPVALKDKGLNDAALAVLDALGKQKSAAANDAIKTALDSADHLLRRRAVALLKANNVGDFSDRIGGVQTRNTTADYQRAVARIGTQVRATVTTSKGAFVIELLPEDAPLTVDNFVSLARKGYFNGQTVPRVVPNFVVQTGDPRGDQNGGPGYQIRCEINEVRYDRGAVGMALSGKDTGGSQWFVTHSPQPHLDGGYTVFGRVIRGMEVVDRIARGDIVKSVRIVEVAPRTGKPSPVKTTARLSQKRA
jgi:cyclophilin family peptidyl-prolyl cis-trans isomerase/HEAT repeat protein